MARGRPRCNVARDRFFCFTIHVQTQPNINTDGVRFYIMQKERCPTSGRIHWQGYIEFIQQVRLASVKAALGNQTAHVENARGDAQQNITYCSKIESRADPNAEPVRFGEPSPLGRQGRDEAGERSNGSDNLTNALASLDSGSQLTDLIDTHPKTMTLHGPKLEVYLTKKRERELGNKRPVYAEVRWGDCGTGKTESIDSSSQYGRVACGSFVPPLECWDPKNVFLKCGMGNWFDGYDGQPVIVFDDFYPKTNEDAEMLMYACNKRYYRAPVKGGSVLAQWHHVVIICNTDPRDWFKDEATGQFCVPYPKRKALLDRFRRTTHFVGQSHRANDPDPPFRDGTGITSEPPVAQTTLPEAYVDSQLNDGETIEPDDEPVAQRWYEQEFFADSTASTAVDDTLLSTPSFTPLPTGHFFPPSDPINKVFFGPPVDECESLE